MCQEHEYNQFSYYRKYTQEYVYVRNKTCKLQELEY